MAKTIKVMKQILLSLTMVMLSITASADDSGKCGPNVTYSFDKSSKTLTVSGQGRMYDYDSFIPIGFELSEDHPTRGVTSYLSSIKEFEVWAFREHDGTLYMGDDNGNGRKSTFSGNKWGYEPVQPWPSGNLSFLAVTPSESRNFTGKSAASKEGAVSLSHDIHVPTTITEQEDLMMALSSNNSKPESYQPVSLIFNHVLSQVLFTANIENYGYGNDIKATVKEISLMNLYSDGHLVYNGSTEVGGYYNKVNYTLYSSDLSNEVINKRTVKITSSGDSDKQNALFVLPQPSDGSGQVIMPGQPAPTDGKTYLKFRAQLEWNGNIILAGDEADAFYFPINSSFSPGRRYTFCFNFRHVPYPSYSVDYSLTVEEMRNTPQFGWNFDDSGTVTRSASADPDIRPWNGYEDDIRHLVVNEGVTYIGEYTFDRLTNLESVVLPSSLAEMGNSSFNDCSNLSNIYCYAARVPEYAVHGLETSSENCKLHVPASSVDPYKQYFDGLLQKNGSKYFRYIDALQDGDPTTTSINMIPSSDICNRNDYYYNLSGQRVSNINKSGLYIKGRKKIFVR